MASWRLQFCSTGDNHNHVHSTMTPYSNADSRWGFLAKFTKIARATICCSAVAFIGLWLGLSEHDETFGKAAIFYGIFHGILAGVIFADRADYIIYGTFSVLAVASTIVSGLYIFTSSTPPTPINHSLMLITVCLAFAYMVLITVVIGYLLSYTCARAPLRVTTQELHQEMTKDMSRIIEREPNGEITELLVQV
jgi:hypothetical protein